MSSTPLIAALVCAILAIVYGAWSIGWILAKPAGNERMREIAAAVQAGAQAYLNRQYMTIGIVGIVLFVVIWWALGGATAGGFLIGAVLPTAVAVALTTGNVGTLIRHRTLVVPYLIGISLVGADVLLRRPRPRS